MSKPVSFYSEGVKLAGDLFLPADVKQGDRRAGIVLCHGYTGVRSIYLPDNARVLAEAGYVVMSFDYQGWGDSEGPAGRVTPAHRRRIALVPRHGSGFLVHLQARALAGRRL
jgi:predicted alpha/beta hydrolase